jgi:hypothetical protein
MIHSEAKETTMNNAKKLVDEVALVGRVGLRVGIAGGVLWGIGVLLFGLFYQISIR